MTADARRALNDIQRCVAEDRYVITVHFSQRMAQRGLFWPDVLAVIDKPEDVRSDGLDEYDRSKWIIEGDPHSLGSIDIVCALETDETQTTFITLYWQD